MVKAKKKARDESAEVMRGRIKMDAASTAGIGEYVGHYTSKELGAARISQDKDGFQVEFESGSSLLGAEQSGTSRNIVLTTPPWTTRLQPTHDPNTLLVDGGQTTYHFIRIGEGSPDVGEQTERRPLATDL